MRLRRIGVAAIRLSAVLACAYVVAIWIRTIWISPAPLETIRLDWHLNYTTGQRVVSGALADVYVVHDVKSPFVYPPYWLYPAALLALLPEPVAYGVCAAAALLSLVFALRLTARSCPGPADRKLTAAFVVVGSVPFTMTIILGQVSGAIALGVALALFAWVRGREFLAGMALSLLVVKPNYALVVPGLCFLAGRWKIVAGFLTGVAVVLTSTIPLGAEIWRAYFEATRGFAAAFVHTIPMWKHTTLYAFLTTLPVFAGVPATSLTAGWIVMAIALCGLVAAAWWVAWRTEAPNIPRTVGLAVLLMLTAGPYAHYYDCVLLLVPGIAWYAATREVWTIRDSIIAACIAGILVGGYATVLVWKGGTAWTGGFMTVWLVVEAIELLRPRAVAAREGGGSGAASVVSFRPVEP